MNVRAWLAPGPPIVPFPPKTEPCGRIDVFVPPNGEGDAPGALKAFGCVLVPKGELVVEAPNAEGETTGAPKGDAGAAPKAPAGLPNAPGLLPPPKAPPPPKPAENVMLSGTRASKCDESFRIGLFLSYCFTTVRSHARQRVLSPRVHISRLKLFLGVMHMHGTVSCIYTPESLLPRRPSFDRRSLSPFPASLELASAFSRSSAAQASLSLFERNRYDVAESDTPLPSKCSSSRSPRRGAHLRGRLD